MVERQMSKKCQSCHSIMAKSDLDYVEYLKRATDNEDLPDVCRKCQREQAEQQRADDLASYSACS